MNCEQAHELIGADPDALPPELQIHLATCPECRSYREEMRTFNAKLRRALDVSIEAARPATPKVVMLARRTKEPAGGTSRSRWLAITAPLAAGVLIALTLWITRPPQSLAAEVVNHVKGEPESWTRTQPVAAADLAAVLGHSGLKMRPGVEPVVYASSCWFKGHYVPHFVVMTSSGPVTVMILRSDRVKATQQFNEDGFSGLLVPARVGTVAVLSRTPMALERPAGEVVRALESAEE